MDESTDVSDTAQLIILIRIIDTEYNTIEELASLESISGTQKELIFLKRWIVVGIESLRLTWEKHCSTTTDGASNMVGRNTGFVGRIAELTTSKMIETPIFYTVLFINNLCVVKLPMNLEHVMNIVTKTVNFIRSQYRTD